ncbi:hypothetical protein KQH49_01035 [Mycetohabitans sp. B5]|nr:hypothetical protein [Mycetohabitans sp. B5]
MGNACAGDGRWLGHEPLVSAARLAASRHLQSAARGIANGITVRIFDDRGAMTERATVTDRARERVMAGLSIRWKKQAPDGRNANEVTRQR